MIQSYLVIQPMLWSAIRLRPTHKLSNTANFLPNNSFAAGHATKPLPDRKEKKKSNMQENSKFK
jgi:hypothetical protein